MSKNFSDNFKTMRKQRNLIQEQIAETLGVSCQAVSKWETNPSQPQNNTTNYAEVLPSFCS